MYDGPSSIPISQAREQTSDVEAHAEFADFFKQAMPRLLGYLMSISSDTRFVEDIAQESMVITRAHWEKIRSYDRPEAWLFKVATRMLRRWQARQDQKLSSLDDPTGESRTDLTAQITTAWVDDHVDIIKALQSLPPRQAEAAAMHYLLDYPLKDVAAIMHVSEGAVKTHLHRARVALARELREIDHAGQKEDRER
jgi:RNA polymerase sigma-70 factor (ECF subfamily)